MSLDIHSAFLEGFEEDEVGFEEVVDGDGDVRVGITRGMVGEGVEFGRVGIEGIRGCGEVVDGGDGDVVVMIPMCGCAVELEWLSTATMRGRGFLQC